MEKKVIPISLSIEEALLRVRKGLEQIKYGEIVVKVENGKPIGLISMKGRGLDK